MIKLKYTHIKNTRKAEFKKEDLIYGMVPVDRIRALDLSRESEDSDESEESHHESNNKHSDNQQLSIFEKIE